MCLFLRLLCFVSRGPGRRGREMHEETKGDIDKDGRCRGVYSSVMQLYDALFHLAWMVFMIPFLGWTGMKEDWGVETDRGHIGTIEKLCHLHRQHNKTPPTHTNLNHWMSKTDIQAKKWMTLAVNCTCFPPNSFCLYSLADNKLLQLLSKYSPLINNLHILVKLHNYYLIIRFYLSGIFGMWKKKKPIFVKASHSTRWALISHSLTPFFLRSAVPTEKYKALLSADSVHLNGS